MHKIPPATGGVSTLETCFWVPINYYQSNGTWLYKSPEGTGKIKVMDDDRVNQDISRLKANKAEGIMWGMTSSQHKYGLVIWEITKNDSAWADKVWNYGLHYWNVWKVMWTTVYKTIEYAISICTLTKEGADGLLQPFLWRVLSKLGVLFTMKQSWVYTPSCFQYLCDMNIYTEQTVT